MHKLSSITLSMIFLAMAGITSNAFAQEKTRAEIRQELIQAENNGLHFVTDISYSEINPILEQQAPRLKQQSDSGVGADMTGSSAAGTTRLAKDHPTAQGCVGPVDFCAPYFGS
ncbi:DUF4148 domain-containing protein [Paraburkholderia sp. FT54]|uniref:DUF4148 domain-containing protein n=1 Tax=Paraburkholderia sp. FT54 TaxID=3074437 RepID=UPI0028779D7B|nr:DUF4148 domain-containing protein [Paraburkholderia sp. FT54]WNC89136.1 DUF4148 domain-containing protein [Paraburkholderia sp. FT54]